MKTSLGSRSPREAVVVAAEAMGVEAVAAEAAAVVRMVAFGTGATGIEVAAGTEAVVVAAEAMGVEAVAAEVAAAEAAAANAFSVATLETVVSSSAISNFSNFSSKSATTFSVATLEAACFSSATSNFSSNAVVRVVLENTRGSGEGIPSAKLRGNHVGRSWCAAATWYVPLTVTTATPWLHQPSPRCCRRLLRC